MRLPVPERVRTGVPLFVVLAAALAAVGVVADRALVREAAASAALAVARTENDMRSAALSVRGALGQIEQAVLAGASPPGVSRQALALSPPLSFASGRSYRDRPTSELLGLLTSSESTAWGLPEAVVAAAALNTPGSQRTVAERLLTGQLPVRVDDVPHLARVLGAAGDPRVAALQDALRGVPDDLPAAPAFRRAMRGGVIEAWTRQGRESVRYEVAAATLFESAGVADRAVIRGGGVAVPDVPGFALALRTPPAALRPATGRLLVWTAVAACLAALALVQRSLAREARAISREKAFVAGVTHELRTPVAAIRVFGEALAEGAGDPREYGTLVAEESERLEALVERVLAATRIDEAPRFAAVRPSDLVASAVGLMRPRAERRGVTLRVEAEVDAGNARWDGDAVRRALLNLIDNAIKHGRPAGAVEAGARAEGEHVRLWVRDDGPGITRRDRERVFGRFERGATEASGTGLGLYLVDQVVRAHGGRVHLATAEGQGCTFDILLPRQPQT
jgi:signal transduction histidine kinase